MKTLPIICSIVAIPLANASFIAHEWGTFTSLVGSDGITQNGMYHEDEKLPDFVHEFGELAGDTPVSQPPVSGTPPTRRPPRGCHNRKVCFDEAFFADNSISQKMETPVIYFYSDKATQVEVNVKFPEGLITETFPAPVSSFPAKSTNPVLGNGEATFLVNVLPQLTGNLPATPAGSIYAHARQVQSNVVKSLGEEEKFIFYRGLGRFQPRIAITSKDGALSITGSDSDLPQAAFLIHVDEKGSTRGFDLGNLKLERGAQISAPRIAALSNHSERDPSALTGPEVKNQLVKNLISQGLNADEALAMLNTWENGYLKAPGLRLLYVLPRAEVDQVLPLAMVPAPKALARVFVGRIEILLDTQEQKILTDITMKRRAYDVSSLGRFAESILQRVKQVYLNGKSVDPSLLAVIDSLIDRAAVGDSGGSQDATGTTD